MWYFIRQPADRNRLKRSPIMLNEIMSYFETNSLHYCKANILFAP